MQFIPYLIEKKGSGDSLSIIHDQEEPDGNKQVDFQKEEILRSKDIDGGGDSGRTNTNGRANTNNNILFELNNKDITSSHNIDAILNKIKMLFSYAQRGFVSKPSFSTLKSGFKSIKNDSDDDGKKIIKPRRKENSFKKDESEKKELFFYDFETLKNYAHYFIKNNCENLVFKYSPKIKNERRRKTERSSKNTFRSDY